MPEQEYLVEHVGPHGFVVQQPVPSKAHAERFAAKQPYDGRFPRILRREVGPWEPAPAEDGAEGDQRTGPERVRDAIRRDRGRDAPTTVQGWA